jgi:RNA ligase (TIGR02306 family)
VKPHPNADRLELAYIGGWQLIVPKGEYSKGDLVVYFPADSLIPEKWLEQWGLVGKLAGSQRNRVKPVKLRGERSIGIICHAPDGYSLGDSMAEYYNVERWEEPIPLQMQGKMRHRPEGYLKYDLENINNEPDTFTDGMLVYAHEKIHGTHIFLGLVNDEFLVGSKNICLQEDENNVYWKIARKYRFEDALRDFGHNYVFIHGEVYGPIQDMKYGSPQEPQFAAFDLRVYDPNTDSNDWMPIQSMESYLKRYGIPTVPLLYKGPFSKEVLAYADGQEQVSGKELHIREGCVIRSAIDRRILKVVSDAYYFRRNGTEFH